MKAVRHELGGAMGKFAEDIANWAKGRGLGFIPIAVALVLMAARIAAPPSLANYETTPMPTPTGIPQPHPTVVSQPPRPGEDNLEERMARIEGAMEQMDRRMGRVETGMSELRGEMGRLRTDLSGGMSELRGQLSGDMDQLRAEMNQLRSDIRGNFQWTLGLLISMWITIIVAILFRGGGKSKGD